MTGVVATPISSGLVLGDAAPPFHAAALGGNPRYAFDTVAGRFVLMLFFGSAQDEAAKAALGLVNHHAAIFNDSQACFYGITHDTGDAAEGRIAQSLPGRRYFLDYDRAVATLYAPDPKAKLGSQYWVLLDPMMRVAALAPIGQTQAMLALTAKVSRADPPVVHAPVLVVPNVFDPTLCRRLIDVYERGASEPSGFMREVGGKTVVQTDPGHKVRRDLTIADASSMAHLRGLIARRLVPQIAKAFQFNVTRMERYLVACYEAETGGHFAPHRDNTTKGTAHRRFAVTINLNAEDYDGGDLAFPEFGPTRYRAPTGGAIVFGCSLLHTVAPVTRGRRFAFLPFLYDDAAAAMRAANNAFLGEGTPVYVADSDRL